MTDDLPTVGRYALLRLLGTGGMGQVFEAELRGPAGFRKRVALKLLKAGPAADEQLTDALAREARLGALLSHPNVVGTYELGQEDGEWFVAMELVRGTSVAQLAADGPLAPAAVLEVALQACAGLAHVHSLTREGTPLDLVHRDVKPRNLLVDRAGLVKLSDFGVAQLARSAHRPAGTPGYMAPEQVQGLADQRSDVFAMGVVLYRLATGRAPFGRGHEGLEQVARVEERLADPAFLEPLDEVVPGLADVVKRCLHEEPEARWPTAGALGQALRNLTIPPIEGPTLADRMRTAVPDLHPDEWVGIGRSESDVTGTVPGFVPHPADAFVGRVLERDRIAQLLRSNQLITLVGPAGVGKTRLAIEVAAAIRPSFPGGAWFCDLADARDPETACVATARSLKIPLTQGLDSVRQLGHALAARGRILLVLDNFEGVAEHAADTISRWLVLAPDMRVLVTSRVALRITGEHRESVEPLTAADGEALFRVRAGAEVPDDQRAALHELVHQLDGLPLAIELAAARAPLMSPRTLVDRLPDRFRVLTRSRRDVDARHATLRIAIDGSWDLLTDWERAAWAQLSVFSGGCTLQAADAVLDLSDWPDAPWTLDVLSSLLDHSLLRLDAAADRFTMLLSLQEYGAHQLVTPGAVKRPDGSSWSGPAARDAAEHRHGEHYARHGAREAIEALHTTGGTDRTRALGRELDNLVLATRRAVARGDGAVAAYASLAATEVTELRGPLTLGATLTGEVLPVVHDPHQRAEVLRTRGWALHRIGRSVEAEPVLREALPLCEATGDHGLASAVWWALSACRRRVGDLAGALECAERAHEAAVASGSRRALATILSNRAVLFQHVADYERARPLVEEAWQLFRTVGDERGCGIALSNLGVMLQGLGRYAEAYDRFQEALTIHRRVGDRQFQALTEAHLGTSLHLRGLLAEALPHYQRSVQRLERVGARPQVMRALCNLGELHLDLSDNDAAIPVLEKAASMGRESGSAMTLGRALHLLGEAERRKGRWQSAQAHLDEAEATLRPTGDPAELGELLCRLAVLAIDRGRLDEAEARIAEATSLAPGLEGREDYNVDRLLADARQALQAARAGPCS